MVVSVSSATSSTWSAGTLTAVAMASASLRCVGGSSWVILSQGTDRVLGDPGDRLTGSTAQPDRRGDSFAGAQQQRREAAAAPELVATIEPSGGFHGVAEVAQPFDVAAQRPVADAQSFGQIVASPAVSRLQEPQKVEHPPSGAGHRHRLGGIADKT